MDHMQEAWLRFAHTGNPSIPGTETWPRYDLASRATMELGTAFRVLNDPYREQRAAWDGVPFDNERPNGDQATALLSEN
jgi:para-nitrobenzyl esterase